MATTNDTTHDGAVMWQHTHDVIHNGERHHVYLLNGAAYTREEWESDAGSDWTFDGDGLLFQGRVPAGESRIDRPEEV